MLHQLIVSNFWELFDAHGNCCLLSWERCNVLTTPNKSINMTNILMRGLISLLLLFHVVFPVDSTRGFVVEGPTCQIARLFTLESLRRLQTLLRLCDLAEKLPKSRKRKPRTRKKDLPYHKRRRRVEWHEWVRELGPDDFYIHHRMWRATFEKLLSVLGDSLETDARKVRYGSGPVTPRMQLTMCLKFLGGDSNHDMKKHMGGLFVLCVHHRQKIYKRHVL